MNFVRISIIVLIALAAAAGGLVIGINYEKGIQDEEDAYRAMLGAKARTIAVVSLDEGVNVEGVNQKYANTIIESIGRHFNFTTYQMAQQGLEDGAFDAIILFPPDFSEKVSSVNAMNPRKISIDYQINEQLPEAAYIDTFQIITEFQVDINSTLSYMYLVSIYEEMHDAQDKTGRLLSNNEKVLEAIEEVDDFNFMRNLNMGDLPQVKLEMQTTDFTSFVTTVNDYASDMNKVYTDSYALAQQDYQGVLTQLATDIKKTKDASDDIKGIYTALTSSGTGSWLSQAQAYDTSLRAWRTGANSWLSSSQSVIDVYKAELAGLNAVVDVNKDEINAKADLIYSTVDRMLNTGSPLTSADISTLQAIIDARDAAPPGTDPLKVDNSNFARLASSIQSVSSLSGYTTAIPTAPGTLSIPGITDDTFTDFNDALADVETTATSYDPLNYLTTTDEAAASSIISAYKSEVDKTKGEFDKLQATHIEVVNGAFMEYNRYIGDLRQSVHKAYTDELDQIDSAKDIFVETGKTTSEENHILISDFASKMPNSRSGQSVNQTVAEFVASPVELAGTDIRGVVETEDDRIENLLLLILSICLIALIITIIMYTIRYRRNKNETDERT